MNWIFNLVLCVALVELAMRLPFGPTIADLGRAGRKALHVVGSKAISDHWKEKAVGAYSRTTFLSALKLAGLLVVLFGAAALLVVAFDFVAAGFESFMLGWVGITGSVVLAGLYFLVRKRIADARVQPSR